jgi:hypothetical protein
MTDLDTEKSIISNTANTEADEVWINHWTRVAKGSLIVGMEQRPDHSWFFARSYALSPDWKFNAHRETFFR